MKVFTTDKIRNVVLLGHGGSGKTSLVEAIAYLAGMTTRMGSVDAGNTLSDYDKEEIKRKISIKTTVFPIEWDGYKINLLDTQIGPKRKETNGVWIGPRLYRPDSCQIHG